MKKKTAAYKKVRYQCQLLCFFIILIFSSLSEAAVKELLISSSADLYQLGYHIQTLEDKTGELSITDVSSSRFDKQFINNHTAGINKGLTDSFLWLRFSLAANDNDKGQLIAGDTANRTEWLIYLGKHLDYYDEIKVYWQEGIKWQTKIYGQHQALKRKIRDPLCIRIILPEDGLQPVTYYIRMNIKSGFFLKPTIYSIAGYDRFSKKMSLFYGGYYGLALGLVVYNLFLYLFLGDRIRFLFIMYVLSLSSYFVITNEFGYPFLSTALLPATKKAAQFLCLLFIIQFTHFSVVFLDARNTIPRFYRLLQFAMLSIFCLLLSMPFVSFTSLGKIVGIYAPIIFIQIMLAGIAAWHSGYRPARLFVFAWLFLLGGAIINSLTFVGIFPYPFIGDHAIQAGSGIEMIFLSLAMAERVRFAVEKLNQERIMRERQLNGLTHQLVETEERERRRMAEVLHDSIGQTLVATKWEIQQLLKVAGLEELQKPMVLSYIDSCIKETRTLTTELYPQVLYSSGLGTALQSLAKESGKRFNLNISVNYENEPEIIGEEHRLVFYRSVSELLNNAGKHAEAENVEIELKHNKENISVSVHDDGIGYENILEPSIAKNNFGLFSINERLQHMGGLLTLENSPVGGLKAKLTLPVAAVQKCHVS